MKSFYKKTLKIYSVQESGILFYKIFENKKQFLPAKSKSGTWCFIIGATQNGILLYFAPLRGKLFTALTHKISDNLLQSYHK